MVTHWLLGPVNRWMMLLEDQKTQQIQVLKE
jgi:hypothetical protein